MSSKCKSPFAPPTRYAWMASYDAASNICLALLAGGLGGVGGFGRSGSNSNFGGGSGCFRCGGRAWHILPATSSKRVLNHRFFIPLAS